MLKPHFDPVALSLGAFKMRWYGLMYVAGFVSGWILGRWRVKKPGSGWTLPQLDDMVTLAMLGIIVGGRIGYIVFYDPASYLRNPIEILYIWQGGMSFHGGLLGVLAAVWYFAKKSGKSFLAISDFIAPLVPPGLFFGRLGNFINGELWGKISDLPWAMVFPGGGNYPRHPTQLYEALLEGLALFIIVWIYSSRPRRPGRVSGMFALCYAFFRFLVEFVRVPDQHIGYLAFGWLTMGQLLCLPVMSIGLWLLFRPQR